MDILKDVLPSAGVVFIFWLAIRALIQADRRERAAQLRFSTDRARAVATPDVRVATAGAPAGPVAAPAGTHVTVDSVTSAESAAPAGSGAPAGSAAADPAAGTDAEPGDGKPDDRSNGESNSPD